MPETWHVFRERDRVAFCPIPQPCLPFDPRYLPPHPDNGCPPATAAVTNSLLARSAEVDDSHGRMRHTTGGTPAQQVRTLIRASSTGWSLPLFFCRNRCGVYLGCRLLITSNRSSPTVRVLAIASSIGISEICVPFSTTSRPNRPAWTRSIAATPYREASIRS